MSRFESPGYWLESMMSYLVEANKELGEAADSFVKAIRYGAAGFDESGYCEIIKEALGRCMAEIIEATESASEIRNNIPKEDEKDGEV